MKHPVPDALVAEYTEKLRAGGTVGAIFPQPLSQCDFTEAQKIMIREARKTRKLLTKHLKPQPVKPPQSPPKLATVEPTATPPAKPKPVASKPAKMLHAQKLKAKSLSLLEKMLYPTASKSAIPIPAGPRPKPTPTVQAPASQSNNLTRLEKLLYLQREKCFFCGEKLALEDANIEHLNPVSLGGKSTSDNLVACHKTLNDTFGNLPLKQKFEFVLKAAESFSCPKK